MPRILQVKDWREGEFDTLIDVRSPREFEEDHLPGAINLPVLDDAERAEVGRVYKEESPFQARILGAGLISKNIGNHIANSLSLKTGEWRPLVYCWRGGLRSGSMAEIMSQVGWRVNRLEGGYKTYRHTIIAELEAHLSQIRPLILQGATGSGKTRILTHLAEAGGQILDLEGLANHRGSVLGAFPGSGQPSQRFFESSLWCALEALDLRERVLIEAESSKVGEIHVPTSLWKKMKAAPRLEISLPREQRVALLLEDYRHLTENPAELISKILPLRYRLGEELINTWIELIEAERWTDFVESMLENHYDAAYATALSRREGVTVGQVPLEDLSSHEDSTVLSAIQDFLQRESFPTE